MGKKTESETLGKFHRAPRMVRAELLRVAMEKTAWSPFPVTEAGTPGQQPGLLHSCPLPSTQLATQKELFDGCERMSMRVNEDSRLSKFMMLLSPLGLYRFSLNL